MSDVQEWVPADDYYALARENERLTVYLEETRRTFGSSTYGQELEREKAALETRVKALDDYGIEAQQQATLLQQAEAERNQLRERVKDLEGAVAGKGIALFPNLMVERQDMQAQIDHLRALLILAYEELAEDPHYASPPLLARIADAVSPVGQVTAADIEWARDTLQKHPTDSPHDPPRSG